MIRGLNRPRKEIPCKYLYDERGSALFDEICELDEYYLTRTELAILDASVAEMAEAIGEDCELIELGSGSGLKTRLLLEQLREPRAYLPVDISAEPLERSARELAATLPRPVDHPGLRRFHRTCVSAGDRTPRARRVVYFPGSTIGNFSPRAAIGSCASIAWLVGDGGGLLIGFDLDKDESIVWPAYNDRRGVSAAFNLNLLGEINRELGADFDLKAFAHRADYGARANAWRCTWSAREQQVVRIAGRNSPFEEGETIHTEYSYKYSLEHFGTTDVSCRIFAGRQWTDADRYFCVQYPASID